MLTPVTPVIAYSFSSITILSSTMTNPSGLKKKSPESPESSESRPAIAACQRALRVLHPPGYRDWGIYTRQNRDLGPVPGAINFTYHIERS